MNIVWVINWVCGLRRFAANTIDMIANKSYETQLACCSKF